MQQHIKKRSALHHLFNVWTVCMHLHAILASTRPCYISTLALGTAEPAKCDLQQPEDKDGKSPEESSSPGFAAV